MRKGRLSCGLRGMCGWFMTVCDRFIVSLDAKDAHLRHHQLCLKIKDGIGLLAGRIQFNKEQPTSAPIGLSRTRVAQKKRNRATVNKHEHLQSWSVNAANLSWKGKILLYMCQQLPSSPCKQKTSHALVRKDTKHRHGTKQPGGLSPLCPNDASAERF